MPEVYIDNVGSLGDGMGDLNGATVFVPGTLAGETVLASGNPPRLSLEKIISPSDARIIPECQHFGTCGGCSLQHMAPATMLQWKHDEVKLAFSRVGLDVKINDCVASPSQSRRRVTFTAKRENSDVVLGFKERGGAELINLGQCVILKPEIATHLNDFRSLCATLLRGHEEIQITVNAYSNGLDLNFTLEQDAGEDMLAAFVRSFARMPFLRAGVNGEVIVAKERPMIDFDGTQVTPPVGSFVQAVASAEAVMADLVCAHLKSRKRVVDLFCGSGTFALRLAKNSRVHAVEGESNAIASINSASRVEGTKSISTEVRDLEQLPLTKADLKLFDGLCLDPPRAGAEPQIKEIAKSDIRALAYVSCNPVSLARDARALVNAGYKIESVTPIDQFVFSTHVEVVALFSKKSQKAKMSIFR